MEGPRPCGPLGYVHRRTI